MALRTLRRLVHAVDNFGGREALRRGLKSLLEPDLLKPPQPLPGRLVHPFDRARGVETGGYVPGEDLSGGGFRARFFRTAYQAISPSSLRGALELLPETLTRDPAGFTFVDIGCGKGRALLVAAEFGFGAVAGVELTAELCRVARANVEARGLAERVSVAEGDACSFAFPEGPLVVFLYHPFLVPVLRRTLRSLRQQVAARPRPVYLLYANPSYHRAMMRERWLTQVWDYGVALSEEDAAADNFDIPQERYTLYRAEL